MFSKASEYGIKAVTYIAHQSQDERRVKLNEITEATDSPSAFSAKILHQLAKANIVESISGPNGGFFMNPSDQKRINLMQIIQVLDERYLLDTCVLGLSECDLSNPCPMHDDIAGVKQQLKEILYGTTVADLVSKVANKESYLKII